MASALAAFEASLASLSVERTHTTAAGFTDALTAAVEPPAVGTEIPFEGVSLDGSGVTNDPTPAELEAATTGVTPVRGGIAEYGTLLLDSRAEGDELVSLYPERHVAVLRESDVVPDVRTAIRELGDAFALDPGSRVLATGVSATADMGAKVEGVHGPKAVHVVVVTDR